MHRIKELRKALNIKQVDFAERILTTHGHVSDIENGRKELSDRTIKLICSEFNVNEEWLRTGDGEIFEEYDDTNISAVVREYKLGAMGEDLLKAYVKFPPERREAVNDFLHHLARVIMDGRITQVKHGVLNEVFHTDLTEHMEDSLVRRINAVFGAALPPMAGSDPPPPETSASLQALRAKYTSDITTENAAPAPSLEDEADAYAATVTATAREQYLLEREKGS